MDPAEVAVTLSSDEGCVGSLRCTTCWSGAFLQPCSLLLLLIDRGYTVYTVYAVREVREFQRKFQVSESSSCEGEEDETAFHLTRLDFFLVNALWLGN